MPPVGAAIGVVASFATASLGGAIITGAVVGAAIGGITAAITGGDIGKGLLFGAVGGAVTGAVTFGLSSVLSSTGTGAQATFEATKTASTVQGLGGLTGDTGVTSLVGGAASDATTQLVGAGVKEAATTATKSTFLGKLGKSLGDGFGVAAVGAGIGAIKDVYMGKKQMEFQEEQAALQHQRDLEKMEREAQLAAKYSRGGGGGGGGAQEDWRATEEGVRYMAQAEREKQLAMIREQVAGERSLAQQQIDEQGAARERAKAGAGVKTGKRTGSRSTDTLVDLQERIRSGEGPQGDPNLGVVPPVEYVPPSSGQPATVAAEDVYRTA